MNKHNEYVIIPGGGKGERLGGDIPKQFQELDGTPIILNTLQTFHIYNQDIQIILSLPEKNIDLWRRICETYDVPEHRKVIGGESRFDSVRNGLDVIESEKGVVGVHDAVRPYISQELISRAYGTARQKGNAIPVIDVVDSIIDTSGNHIDRKQLKSVQTPQCFKVSNILTAYESAISKGKTDFTDDAQVAIYNGQTLNLIEGERTNTKITFPEDIRNE